MSHVPKYFKNINAKLDTYLLKTWYMFSELYLARFCTKRKMNILFSKKETWEPRIRRLGRFLPHTFTFAEFNPQTIAEHDLVIPLIIEDVFYLNDVRHLIKDNPIPVPSIECVKLCDDKYEFAKYLIANNFADYIPQINGDLSYPFFLKKKVDMGGVHTHLVENREQELALSSEMNSDEYFRQQFISGTREYATHIFFNKQGIVRAVTMEHLFEKDNSILNKNDTLRTKMHKNNPEHLDLFAAILKSIGYEGICCFDYKIVNNRPIIFEINPRVGGSFSLYLFSFLRSIH
jgi:hypothetical protein